jgi:hypothetical protein
VVSSFKGRLLSEHYPIIAAMPASWTDGVAGHFDFTGYKIPVKSPHGRMV